MAAGEAITCRRCRSTRSRIACRRRRRGFPLAVPSRRQDRNPGSATRGKSSSEDCLPTSTKVTGPGIPSFVLQDRSRIGAGSERDRSGIGRGVFEDVEELAIPMEWLKDGAGGEEQRSQLMLPAKNPVGFLPGSAKDPSRCSPSPHHEASTNLARSRIPRIRQPRDLERS